MREFALSGHSRTFVKPDGVRSFHPATSTRRMGRLRKTAARSKPRHQVSGSLHTPSRNLQRPPDQLQRHPRNVSLARLSRRQQTEIDHNRFAGVHPAVPAAHSASWVRQDPPFRDSLQPAAELVPEIMPRTHQNRACDLRSRSPASRPTLSSLPNRKPANCHSAVSD